MKQLSQHKQSIFMVVSGEWKGHEFYPPTFVKSQTESLRNAGYEVFWGIVDDRTSMQGIIRNFKRLRQEISDIQPEVVHAQYGSMTALLACLVKGKLPLVISFCGDDLLGTPHPNIVWQVRGAFSRILGLWAAMSANSIIAKSSNILKSLPHFLQKKATILPNGVDIERFKPLDVLEARRKLGWSVDEKIVLFNASQNEDQYRKNPKLAKDTIDLLAKRIPNISLQILSKASLEEVVLSMNAADCLLVTSLQEGSPNIVKEAMACNLPIVSVPCGDVVERLAETRPGSVQPYNAKNLADGILDVMTQGTRSNGRAQVTQQKLSTVNVQEKLTEVYREIWSQQYSFLNKELA